MNLTNLLLGTATVKTSTNLVIDYGNGGRDEFTGVGVTYNQFNEPVSGTITGYRAVIGSTVIVDVSGLSASAVEFMSYIKNADTVGGLLYMLSGDDQLSGSAFADFFAGGNGNDTLTGFGGDDILIGNGGNDLLDGGGGTDTVAHTGLTIANFTFVRTPSNWIVADKTGGYGVDTLVSIERFQASDRTLDLTLSDSAVAGYAANILRASNELSMLAANGLTTRQAALTTTIQTADATTSVATLAYQFFTGKIPTAAGVDYLVSTSGGNANNLNSAYYQNFNLENRYINFSVNLGKLGDGRAQFAADYGSLDLSAATKKAYGVIFGVAPTDAKVAALLAGGRDQYFAYYGQDGVNGIGTKAAMVGWLLAEAEKADAGVYARSNAAFLADLSDGAAFAVDLVGVYGRPEFAV